MLGFSYMISPTGKTFCAFSAPDPQLEGHRVKPASPSSLALSSTCRSALQQGLAAFTREVAMNPFASYSTPPPYRSSHVCPRCGRGLGTADIHSVAIGVHRKAFYLCGNEKCRFEWTEQWRSFDRAELIGADELLAVHEALMDFEGPLTRLLEVPEP